MGLLTENILVTLMRSNVDILTSGLIAYNLCYVFFLLGYILLLFETRIKAIRICMILAIFLCLMLSLTVYLIFSKTLSGETAELTSNVFNVVYNLLWVYIIAILLQHKPLTNVGWIQVIAIVMIMQTTFVLTNIVAKHVDFVKINLTDFSGFPYSMWGKYILANILGTIAFYYMATSEVFHRHRLDYTLDVNTSRVYSPFNKWMLSAVVVPVVVVASLIVVYQF